MDYSRMMKLFSAEIFPGFPFREKSWKALVFDRDQYEAFLPEKCFRAAEKAFNKSGDLRLYISYEMPDSLNAEMKVANIPFDWLALREFAFSGVNDWNEYKMVSSDYSCAIWSDQEITVFGGKSENMDVMINLLGGPGAVVKGMVDEMLLGDEGNYPDYVRYIRRLVYPS